MYLLCMEPRDKNIFHTFVWVVRHGSYECCIGVGHQSRSVEVKKTILFRTPILVIWHVSYECHRSIGHRYVSDTATHLVLKVFVAVISYERSCCWRICFAVGASVFCCSSFVYKKSIYFYFFGSREKYLLVYEN